MGDAAEARYDAMVPEEGLCRSKAKAQMDNGGKRGILIWGGKGQEPD